MWGYWIIQNPFVKKILEVLKKKETKIFVSTALIYILSLSIRRYVHSEDEWGYFLITYSVVEYRTFIIDQAIEDFQLNLTHIIYHEGHYYSVYTPGYPFLCVPFYILGKAIWFLLAQLGLFSNPSWWFKRFAYWSMMMVSLSSTSLTSVLIYRLSKTLNFTEKIATVSSLTYAYGTIVWVYAKSAFSHPTSALFVMGAIYLAIIALDENNQKKVVMSGLALGYAIFMRYPNLLLTIPLASYIYLKTRKFENLILFLCPVFCGGIGLLFYNFSLFGNPFLTGYRLVHGPTNLIVPNWEIQPIYIGLFGLLFGISRGLLPYSPVLIFSVIGMYPWRDHKEEYFLFLSSFFTLVLFFSNFAGWFGGSNWGARYTIEVISCFVMLMCPVIQKYGSKLWFWILYYILLVYSSFSSLVGVSWRIFVPFLGYYPVFGHLDALITPDTLLSYIIYTIGFPSWSATILLAVLVTLSYILVMYPTVFSDLSRRLTTRSHKAYQQSDSSVDRGKVK